MPKNPSITLTAVLFFTMSIGPISKVSAVEICSPVNATYKMSGNEMATVTLTKLAEPTVYSDLQLGLNIEGNSPAFFFELMQSNGYGLQYLSADERISDDQELPIFFFNAVDGQLSVLAESIPSSDQAAPDAIFMPTIGRALWYDTNGSDTPILIPTEIWYRSSCGN